MYVRMQDHPPRGYMPHCARKDLPLGEPAGGIWALPILQSSEQSQVAMEQRDLSNHKLITLPSANA